MKKNSIPIFELLALLIGEAAVSLITVLVFTVIGKFSFAVIFGLILGTAVSIINFIILSVLASRAVDRVMARRPEGEMDEEEAAEFAAKRIASPKSWATAPGITVSKSKTASASPVFLSKLTLLHFVSL